MTFCCLLRGLNHTQFFPVSRRRQDYFQSQNEVLTNNRVDAKLELWKVGPREMRLGEFRKDFVDVGSGGERVAAPE